MQISLLLFFFFCLSVTADDYGNTIATASLITIGQGISGSIETGGDIDMFKIKLMAGRTYVITMESSFDNHSDLFDGSGTKLAQGTDQIGSNGVITFTPSSTAYYYVQCIAYSSSDTGPYNFATADINTCTDSCTSIFLLIERVC